MARMPASELRRLEAIDAPEHAEVLARANEFIVRRGISINTFADLVGVGSSTMNFWIRDVYESASATPRSTAYVDARVWLYITRHWPQEEEASCEQLLETKGYLEIRECIEDAVENGANSLIYGPPSSEKSFVAEQIVAQYRAKGRRDLIYIPSSAVDYSSLSLFKDLARDAEVWMRSGCIRDYVEALVEEFRSRETLPAIVLDEAQYIDPKALETLRVGIHERTKRNRPDGSRRGVGMVILGSHTLYSFFTTRKFRFEQFLSRLSHRVQLTGMSEEEVLEIGARALGANGKKAKLTDEVRKWLLDSCRVVDPYATDAQGKGPRDAAGKAVMRTYYSSRRLLEAIRQKKCKGIGLIIAEAVA